MCWGWVLQRLRRAPTRPTLPCMDGVDFRFCNSSTHTHSRKIVGIRYYSGWPKSIILSNKGSTDFGAEILLSCQEQLKFCICREHVAEGWETVISARQFSLVEGLSTCTMVFQVWGILRDTWGHLEFAWVSTCARTKDSPSVLDRAGSERRRFLLEPLCKKHSIV